MQVTLDIRDDFFDKFIHLLDALPSGVVRVKNDPLSEELQKRIEDIDKGKETLTPYLNGMDEMLQRVKSKYADS